MEKRIHKEFFGEARVISMQDLQQRFSKIKEKIENKVFDQYLLNFIETPVIDDDKLLLLVSLMDQLGLSESQMENYALSTMLIQIALDTHEHISDITDEKSRQLTVLTGDYFSGLYYKLLANTEDILMIRTLSSGIKEVNEQKIFVYDKDIDGIEGLMTRVKLIESSLLIKLSEYFKADLWNECFSQLLLFKRLIQEKSHFLQKESTIFFETLKSHLFYSKNKQIKDLTHEQENQLMKVFDSYLEASKRTVEAGIKQVPCVNELLEKRISTLLNQYQPFVNTYAEEG